MIFTERKCEGEITARGRYGGLEGDEILLLPILSLPTCTGNLTEEKEDDFDEKADSLLKSRVFTEGIVDADREIAIEE